MCEFASGTVETHAHFRDSQLFLLRTLVAVVQNVTELSIGVLLYCLFRLLRTHVEADDYLTSNNEKCLEWDHFLRARVTAAET